jgi:pimeloyl-ACP methyl ester carboxylesterase
MTIRTRIIATNCAVLCLIAALCVVATADVKIEEGEMDGAPFRILMPDDWNNRLILFAHGYSGSTELGRGKVPLEEYALDHGYAMAYSGYNETGWAVGAGVACTDRLRQHFVEKYSMPERTYIAGASMGGTITVCLMETYPDTYDGGLPMAGAVASPLDFWKRVIFDLRVVFDYYCPDIPGTATEFPEGFSFREDVVPVVRKLMKDEKKTAELTKVTGVQSYELASMMWFATEGLKELYQRCGGNPFSNTCRYYSGSSDDRALNKGVRRYESDRNAVEYLLKYYEPTGGIQRPIVALHGTGDTLVPIEEEHRYKELLEKKGNGSLFVVKVVDRPGHVTFRPEEMARAFEELVGWVEHGTKPAFGDITHTPPKKKREK